MALRFLNSGYFAGKVGIGTASPVAKLDVLGTSGGPTVFDYQYATNAGVRIHGDESAMDIVGTDSGNHASTILLRNGNEGFGLLNNPNLNTLQFRSFTASADGFAIHNTGSGLSSLVDIITLEKTGNVGIGTVSPVGKLYVGPTWDTTQNGNNLYIKSSGATNDAYDPQLNNTTDLGITMVRDSATTTGPDTVGLTLYNDDGTAGGFSPMLLFSKLETPTSQYKATMAGIYARSPLGTGNGGSWIDGELIFATAGAATQGIKQRMVINKEGLVGIGTSTPSANLYVSGSNADATDKPTMMSESVFTIKPVALNSGNLNFAQVDGGNSIGMQYTNGAGTANWDISMQPFGGNVGIGAVSPLGRLQVNEYTVASQGNQGDHGELSVFANSGDDSLFLGIKDAAYPNRGWSFNPVTNGVNSNLQFKEHGSTSVRMTIESGGSVGINTTSPDFKLDVDGTFGVSDLPFNSSSVSVLVANETIGAETITNGDFATDADWTKSSNVSISGGQATFTANSAAQYIIQGSLWPANSLSGQKVKLTYTIVSNSLNGGDFRIGGYTGASAFTLNGLVTTVGTHNIILEVRTTAGDDNAIDLYITSAATSGALVIDNVSVKQVTSASNQIQKRQLGTGAFGPTPVGAYLPLAGGTMTGDLKLNNSVRLKLGTSSNTSIYNDGTDTYIQQTSGNLYLWQSADDKDIIFASDNGSGGVAAYFQLDGSHTQSIAWKDIHFVDGIKAKFGDYASPDLEIYHDGSNSYIRDQGSGNLIITGSQLTFSNVADTEYMVKMVQDGTVELYYNGSKKLETTSAGVTVTGEIQLNTKALLSNQENTDVDTGAEVVAQVSTSTYTAAFFDFVIKKVGNIRSGTVYACHDGTNVEFTETSTNDLGDTSDVTLSVDISGTNMRLLATVTSDDWSVKSLIRAI